jgi:hypothetical protein
LGPGRYWADGFGLLSLTIRDRCAGAKPVVLAGEHCGEPWLPYLDLMLTLNVSDERTSGGDGPWSVIPFFPAVYHTSVICYGSYGSLVYPPYDERWPAEKAPPERLTLLDRKFAGQFCLEQARSFVWGMQPMIPNFLPSQLHQRREEIDYATRLARTRVQSLKYVVDGTWLRPPAMDVPQRELDIAKIGTYTKLSTSKKRVPVALAGAWRAPDGNVGIALASIHDENLRLRLPIDVAAYGLSDRCDVYRIDDVGRHREGQFDPRHPVLPIDLPPHAGCVLELCRSLSAGQSGRAELDASAREEAHRKAQHFIDHARQFARLLDDLGRPEAVAAMARMIAFEEQLYRRKGLVTYMAQECLLDIFTDTTERSPTFMLPRFRKSDDRVSPPSWAFVKNPCLATPQAWQQGLRRQPRCLDWDVAAYRQMSAPAAIQEHPPQLSAREMLKFVIGFEDDPSRYDTRDNAAILVVLGEESSRLAAANDPLRTAFDACARPFRQRAVLAIGPMPPPSDLAVQYWHVPVNRCVSPLRLWDRLAAKLVLNTVSTATMARLGRLQSNWMVYVETTNKKLIDRGTRLVAELSGVDYKTACYALYETMEELTRSVRPGDERPSAVALTISRLTHAKPAATR